MLLCYLYVDIIRFFLNMSTICTIKNAITQLAKQTNEQIAIQKIKTLLYIFSSRTTCMCSLAITGPYELFRKCESKNNGILYKIRKIFFQLRVSEIWGIP